MFDNAAQAPEGKRARQTKVMNALFDKDQAGNWVLNVNKPLFKEHEER